VKGQTSYTVLYTENLKFSEDSIIQYKSGKCNLWSNNVFQMHSLILCLTHFLFSADTKKLLTSNNTSQDKQLLNYTAPFKYHTTESQTICLLFRYIECREINNFLYFIIF
jgi:hypothetical protein